MKYSIHMEIETENEIVACRDKDFNLCPFFHGEWFYCHLDPDRKEIPEKDNGEDWDLEWDATRGKPEWCPLRKAK